MTLEETIQQYKNDSGFTSADIMFNASLTDSDWKEIARIFAKAKLEEAAEEKDGEIDRLAKEYAESANSCYTNDYYGYMRGYEDALESITNINLD